MSSLSRLTTRLRLQSNRRLFIGLLRTLAALILLSAFILLVSSFSDSAPSRTQSSSWSLGSSTVDPSKRIPFLLDDADFETLPPKLAKSSPSTFLPIPTLSRNSDNLSADSGLLNPHPYKFIILEKDICSQWRNDLFIISVVHTAPGNYKRRMVIRETWGSQKIYQQTKTVVVFAMGATESKKVQNSVRRESERYRDIIQEDFLDSYRNLTLKGVMWLKWITQYCPNASFVLKVDDDIFVNIFNLVTHLHNLQGRQQLGEKSILCLLWTRMPVMRDPKNKWFVSREDYGPDFFSWYCSGSAYVLTQFLVRPMFIKSFATKFFWVDDFYITGLLPKNMSVDYKNIGSLYVLKGDELQEKLVNGFALFGHVPGSLNQRYKLWKEILKLRGILDWQ